MDRFPDVPTDAFLNDAINGWPHGTRGYEEDKLLISKLNELCRHHGYGCIAQLATWIEDLWRHPEKVQAYEEMRRHRLDMLASGGPDVRGVTPAASTGSNQ